MGLDGLGVGSKRDILKEMSTCPDDKGFSPALRDVISESRGSRRMM